MRKSMTAVFSVFFILAVIGCGNRPYMTVNGKIITVSEFNKAMKANMPPKEEQFPGIEDQVKSYTENQLIRETVMEQLQATYNIELTEAEKDQIYNYFVLSYRRYPTLQIAEELFPYYENGRTKEDIRKLTADTLIQNKIVKAVYADAYQEPTEDQILAWYNGKKETDFNVPKCYYVSQIYVEKPAKEVETDETTEKALTDDSGAEVGEVIEETVTEEEVVEQSAAEKLFNELQESVANITSEKAFMKTAAKYMKDNPYFNKKDYKANRGFIYITEETKEIDDLLKDVPQNGVSSVFDYEDYNAYIVFYVYGMIPEHTVELDQIRSFAEIEAGVEQNRALFEQFYNEKISGAEVVYNEADRLAAKEEIRLEEEEIELPGGDAPVVEDGIDDTVMDDTTANQPEAAE